jgi:hypothetical protein
MAVCPMRQAINKHIRRYEAERRMTWGVTYNDIHMRYGKRIAAMTEGELVAVWRWLQDQRRLHFDQQMPHLDHMLPARHAKLVPQ